MAVLPPDPVFCLKNDMGHVHSMCFDNDEGDYNDTLYAATELGFVYIWDLNKNRLKHKQHLGESIQTIHCLDKNLITQEKNGILKIWGKCEVGFNALREFNFYGGYCKSKLLNNNQLILPQDGSLLELIDLKNFESIKKYKPTDNLGSVLCLETITINNTSYILAGYETGDVILYDYNTTKICSKLKLRECITSLTYDSCSQRGISSNISNILELFTIGNDLHMKLKCEINVINDGCTIVKIRPDRKIFVSGGSDARLRLFSWKTLRTLVVLNEHRKTITDVQFTSKNVKVHEAKLMACSSADGGISLWNLYN